MNRTAVITFQSTIWEFYHEHGRHDLLWRLPEPDGSFDPYKIMVSELMLQQTQVTRVIPKYQQFLELFPTVRELAAAELGDVLRSWSGLGYNRRAKFLWQAAQQVVNQLDGLFPDTVATLAQLPGIGKNTAGAIMAYAFGKPVSFIETNIRSVYIHHFFTASETVSDATISELVTQTLPSETHNYREWYWALMDYGSYLKQTQGNPNRRSTSYAKQTSFHGSRRQLRGQIIKQLAHSQASLAQLEFMITDDRLPVVLEELAKEQLVSVQDGLYSL